MLTSLSNSLTRVSIGKRYYTNVQFTHRHTRLSCQIVKSAEVDKSHNWHLFPETIDNIIYAETLQRFVSGVARAGGQAGGLPPPFPPHRRFWEPNYNFLASQATLCKGVACNTQLLIGIAIPTVRRRKEGCKSMTRN